MPAENQRQADARRRHELAAAAVAAEAAAARLQLDAFVARLTAASIDPEPLQATLLNGTRVKTDKVGWYLNAAQTLAIGPDGTYFQLVTAGGPLARFSGVRIGAGTPTLVIGRGGRDGETGDLADFIDRAWTRYSAG